MSRLLLARVVKHRALNWGTVSAVVIEDKRRLPRSLREMKVLLYRFNPGLSARFNIKSILTLVEENTFSEMRAGGSDMPLQFEFDYRFSRSMKRQCSTPYSYFTSTKSYYPHTFVSTNYSRQAFQNYALRSQQANWLQVREMRSWRAIHGKSVPQKPVRNMSTKDNPGTRLITLYAVGAPKVQPLYFTKLGDHPLQHLPQKEAKELLYEWNQMVCVKGDKGDSENSLVPACLQENVEVNRKKVMAKVYVQDPFNPTWFL